MCLLAEVGDSHYCGLSYLFIPPCLASKEKHKKILHIDSSILGEHSASRRPSAAVVARLLRAEPDATVVYRDLASHNVPQLSGALANFANLPLEHQSAE